MRENQTPVSIALSGAILVVVGLVVKAYLPRLLEVGAFIVWLGWAFIVVAAILFVIGLIRRA